MISMMPSQKSGMAWPATAIAVQRLSIHEWRLSAERMPRGRAVRSATARPARGGERRRGVGVPRLAEIADHRLRRELPVLHVDRLVEAEELVVPLELFLARVLGEEEEHGVAEDGQDGEGEHGDAEEYDDGLDELAGGVASHQRRVRTAGGRAQGPAR